MATNDLNLEQNSENPDESAPVDASSAPVEPPLPVAASEATQSTAPQDAQEAPYSPPLRPLDPLWSSQASQPGSTPAEPVNAYIVTPSGAAKKPKSPAMIVSGLLALMLGSGITGGIVVNALDDEQSTTMGQSTSLVSDSPLGDPEPTEALSKVAAKVAPSVVSIEIRSEQGGSSGSGVILTSDGTILTNNHVVASATSGQAEIRVRFIDGTVKDAEILGRDEATDLAVIKAENIEGLTPAEFGSVNDLSVGDGVLAIGSPLGLEGSVSSGIVSALDRTVRLGTSAETGTLSLVSDAIQTDAAINPGNSGGPLVNMQGQVVGINTAIASLGTGAQAGSIGLGFAISADQAKEISEILAKGETPVRPVLGVSVSPAPEGGASVEEVSKDSPADGKIEVGDIITSFNGEEVTSPEELTALVRAETPGDEASLLLTRDGQEEEVTVILEES